MIKKITILLTLTFPVFTQAQDEKMVTRYYPVDPERWTQATTFEGNDPFGNESEKSSVNDDLVEFFKRYGVSFPEGASLVYEPIVSQLVAVNTPKNIDKIEDIISRSDPDIQQVYVDIWAVSFPAETLQESERKLGRPLQDKEYFSLWKNGEGRRVFSQGIRTINGVNSVIETGKGSSSDKEPDFLLNVTPTVGTRGNINLVMLPAHAMPKDNVKADQNEGLFWELITSVALMDADSIVLGHSSTRDKSHRIILFLSARTVKAFWQNKE